MSLENAFHHLIGCHFFAYCTLYLYYDEWSMSGRCKCSAVKLDNIIFCFLTWKMFTFLKLPLMVIGSRFHSIQNSFAEYQRPVDLMDQHR